MRKTRLNKLTGFGTLIVVISFFVFACGGETLSLIVLTPTPEPTPVPILPPTTGTIAPPTVEPNTPPTVETTLPPTVESILTPTAVPTEPLRDGPIGLTLAILKRGSDDDVSVLEDGGVMTSNDNYGIFFEPSQDSYVYIFQQDTTKAIDVLFPNPVFSRALLQGSQGVKGLNLGFEICGGYRFKLPSAI